MNGPKFIETRFYKYAIVDTKMTLSLDGIVVLSYFVVFIPLLNKGSSALQIKVQPVQDC